MARYRIVPESSRVWIDARSSVHPIHSSTDGLEGALEIAATDGRPDLSSPPSGLLSLRVSRLKSGNFLEDRELQRRVEAKRHPTIEGELIEMSPADGEDLYRVRGRVTFRGVTREYENEMTVAFPDDATVRLEGQAVFDVRDFGMEPPKILLLKVEPEVSVRVEIIAEQVG